MSIGDTYYALTVTSEGASTGAYYSLVPTSNLSILQGGVTFAPSSATQQMTSVNIYSQTLQVSAAPGYMGAGVTIVTGASHIAGQIVVSPPVDVAVEVTLYGNGGAQLGQYIVDPATPGGVFNFPVSGGAPSPDDAKNLLQTLFEKK
jgi:hypothetical protein